MYNSILARSFNKHEQRKLKYVAFVGCFLLSFSLCTVFKPYLVPIHDLNLKLSVGDGVKMRMVSDTISSPKIEKVEDIEENIIVNDTRSSPQVKEVKVIEPKKSLAHNTSSSSPVNEDKDIVIEVPGNDTSSLPQIDEGSEAEEDILIKILDTTSTSQMQTVPVKKEEEPKLVCSSEVRTDFCESQGDIRVHGSSSTVYVMSPVTSNLSENMSKIIKPYARKGDKYAMSMVREWSVKPLMGMSKQVLKCSQNHTVPAILFSTRGYALNPFHDFTDILIPLFLTSRKFNGEVKFLVTDYGAWWLYKYQVILKKLSNYEFIDIDKDDQVHCFPSVTVGLKRCEKELQIDPLKYSYSMKDFRDFLRSSYSLKKNKVIRLNYSEKGKPRLMIITRKRTRSFTNTDQIVNMAKSMGFEVITMEGGGNVSRFAEVVNSCDVLMGVHGAGLTNILFLPENAVFIQIVPYGGVDWHAKQDFGLPSEEMNLKYLLYNIKLEESTLIQQYKPDHPVLKNPSSIKGWVEFRSVYLDKQNVKLNIDRFKPTLQKALDLLHK